MDEIPHMISRKRVQRILGLSKTQGLAVCRAIGTKFGREWRVQLRHVNMLANGVALEEVQAIRDWERQSAKGITPW